MPFETEPVRRAPNKVRPVILATVGSTSAAAGLLVARRYQEVAAKDRVPFQWLAFDTLSYDELITRLQAEEWNPETVRRALTQANYTYLSPRIDRGFDWHHPLNREYLELVFDPHVRRILTNPAGPGAGGAPLIGHIRAMMLLNDLRQKFANAYQAVSRHGSGLELIPGARVFVVATHRGGTGTGASLLVALAARQANAENELILRLLMPDLWSADMRARANSYAVIKEIRYAHRDVEGGTIRLTEYTNAPAPLDYISLIGPNNGTGSMTGVDALVETAEVVVMHLRAGTQSQANATRQDINDIQPFDPFGFPQHVRLETAATFRVVHPEKLDYMSLVWVESALEEVRTRYEEYRSTGSLSRADEEKVASAFASLVEAHKLTGPRLRAEFDAPIRGAAAVSNFIDQIRLRIASWSREQIQAEMGTLIQAVGGRYEQLRGQWRATALKVVAQLAEELEEAVWTASGRDSVRFLALLDRLQQHLEGLARAAKSENDALQRERDRRGTALNEALAAVRSKGGFLSIMRVSDVTRDAAVQVIQIAREASNIRLQIELNEALAYALNLGLADQAGENPVSLVARLRATRAAHAETFQATIQRRQTEIASASTTLRHLIRQHSAVFHRDLLLQTASPETLAALVSRHRRSLSADPAPIDNFLADPEQDFEATLRQLHPHLPDSTQATQPLQAYFDSHPDKLADMIQQMRGVQPYSRVDIQVEQQLGLHVGRTSFSLLALPGGADSPLAQQFIDEGIVPKKESIVDSGDPHEIRLLHERHGLPYEALTDVTRQREEYLRYQRNPQAITPHTRSDYSQVPEISTAEINVELLTTALSWAAEQIGPPLFTPEAGGKGLTLYFEDGDDARRLQFASRDELRVKLTKDLPVRRSLELALRLAVKEPARRTQLETTYLQLRESGDPLIEVSKVGLRAMGLDPVEIWRGRNRQESAVSPRRDGTTADSPVPPTAGEVEITAGPSELAPVIDAARGASRAAVVRPGANGDGADPTSGPAVDPSAAPAQAELASATTES